MHGGNLMFAFPQVLAYAALACALSFGAGYWRGNSSGEAAVQAKWDEQTAAMAKALTQALLDKQDAEGRLAVELKEQSNAHSSDLARNGAALAGARSELARLRAALATAGHREQSPASAAGPAPDGAAATAGDVLGWCAERLVGLGGQADGLAAQVIGLQTYAKTAQQTCGTTGARP